MPWPVHPTGFLASRGDEDSYKIERSLRFNSADSAYLNRTPASAGNQKTWTWSTWFKRSGLGASGFIGGNTNNSAASGFYFQLTTGDILRVGDYATSGFDWLLETTQVFRDVSSWYHVVVSVDTTQATSSNRVKLYINGSQVTSFSTETYPSQNSDLRINTTQDFSIGRTGSYNGEYFSGYLTEIHFIDGQALTPSYFGETDAITGRWKAKAYSGTYGTNGFYLKFADNSGTTATTLGKDSSGNGNNWTPNNFSVTAGADNDSLLDSPTNNGTSGNYCTLNPINTIGVNTFSNGNLDVTIANGGTNLVSGTIAFSSGKWYWEVIPTSGADRMIGISDASVSASNASWKTANGWAYYSDGSKYTNNSGSSYGASYATNDVIGVALNMDSGEITFYKNNLSQGIAFNSGISGKTITPMLGNGATSASQGYTANFGQRPFAYTAPSGFKALCTTNLPQPTIQKPSKYMDVVTWTGNGNSSRSITGFGFSPDLIWMKGRSGTPDHALIDTVRGTGARVLSSNQTSAENDFGLTVTSFDSGGFTVGSGSLNFSYANINSATYVGWAWDEAPIAGMDIVSYTGDGTNRTIAHNLGVAPKMVIVKARSGSGYSWNVWHSSLANTEFLLLESTAAKATDATKWNSTSPTSSVFSLGTASGTNENARDYIAYLFAEVEGFSKFGSYTGNGSADGPFVWCGFRPRWVMIKSVMSSTNWIMFDTARSTYNQINDHLGANTSSAENFTANESIDVTANGFKIRNTNTDINYSTYTHIFAAFAESPFKYARAR